MGYTTKLSNFLKKTAGSYTINLTDEELKELDFFSSKGYDCGLKAALSLVNAKTGEYAISEESRENILMACDEHNAWSNLNWQSSLGMKISKLLEQLQNSPMSSISTGIAPNNLDIVPKDLNHPPTPITRQTEPLATGTNLGPQGEAYDRPYMRREIIDTTKKYAGSEDRNAVVDMAIEKVQTYLLHHGYKPTHPLVRKVVKLQKNYDKKIAQELVDHLVKLKYGDKDPTLMQARLILDHINKLNVKALPSPQEETKEKVAEEAREELKTVKLLCQKLVGKVKHLGLMEEMQQLKVMVASAQDIYNAVKKYNS